MRTYSYNERTKILETKTTGILTVADIISHYERIAMDDSLPRNLKVLIDTRGTRFDINISEMKLTAKAVKNALLKYDYIKESIIVDKPFTTAVALIFENSTLRIESYDFKVFSTENAARSWISLNP